MTPAYPSAERELQPGAACKRPIGVTRPAPPEGNDLPVGQPPSAADGLKSNAVRCGNNGPGGTVAAPKQGRHAQAQFATAVGREMVVVIQQGLANLLTWGIRGPPRQSQDNAAAYNNDQQKQSLSVHGRSLTLSMSQGKQPQAAHECRGTTAQKRPSPIRTTRTSTEESLVS